MNKFYCIVKVKDGYLRGVWNEEELDLLQEKGIEIVDIKILEG